MKLKKIKKYKYSVVMGRFSEKIGDKYQHFPIDNWQNEILVAKKYNFDGLEWIISDYSNPIFNKIYLEDICKRITKNKLIINSIYLDLIMHDPLHKISLKNFEWIIKKIIDVQKKIQINRITLPVEEDARFYFYKDKKIVVNRLQYVIKKLGKKSKISIETDISPGNLINFLNIRKLSKLGLLLDLGNIRADGYNIEDYINNFSNKIFAVHIKYRDKNFGNSKIIPQKFKELSILKRHLSKIKFLNDLTFQTYRSSMNFKTDMESSIKNFNEIFYKK